MASPIEESLRLLHDAEALFPTKHQHLLDAALARIRNREPAYWQVVSEVLRVQPPRMVTVPSACFKVPAGLAGLLSEAVRERHDLFETLQYLDPAALPTLQPGTVFDLLAAMPEGPPCGFAKRFLEGQGRRFLLKHLDRFLALDVADEALVRAFFLGIATAEEYRAAVAAGAVCDNVREVHAARIPPRTLLALVRVLGNGDRATSHALVAWAWPQLPAARGPLLAWYHAQNAFQQRPDALYETQVAFLARAIEECLSDADAEAMGVLIRMAFFQCVPFAERILLGPCARQYIVMAAKARQLDAVCPAPSTMDLYRSVVRSPECPPPVRLAALARHAQLGSPAAVIAALAYFGDARDFTADYRIIGELEERFGNSEETLLALLTCGCPREFHRQNVSVEHPSLEVQLALKQLFPEHAVDAVPLQHISDELLVRYTDAVVASTSEPAALARRMVHLGLYRDALAQHLLPEMVLQGRILSTEAVCRDEPSRAALMSKLVGSQDSAELRAVIAHHLRAKGRPVPFDWQSVVVRGHMDTWRMLSRWVDVDPAAARFFASRGSAVDYWCELLRRDKERLLEPLLDAVDVASCSRRCLRALSRYAPGRFPRPAKSANAASRAGLDTKRGSGLFGLLKERSAEEALRLPAGDLKTALATWHALRLLSLRNFSQPELVPLVAVLSETRLKGRRARLTHLDRLMRIVAVLYGSDLMRTRLTAAIDAMNLQQ